MCNEKHAFSSLPYFIRFIYINDSPFDSVKLLMVFSFFTNKKLKCLTYIFENNPELIVDNGMGNEKLRLSNKSRVKINTLFIPVYVKIVHSISFYKVILIEYNSKCPKLLHLVVAIIVKGSQIVATSIDHYFLILTPCIFSSHGLTCVTHRLLR